MKEDRLKSDRIATNSLPKHSIINKKGKLMTQELDPTSGIQFQSPGTVSATSSQVQAVCDWFGPSELMTMPPNNVGNGRTPEDVARSNGARLLGATVRDVPKLAADASAIDHVSSDDPPFLIMHGDQDPGVPLQQSRKLA